MRWALFLLSLTGQCLVSTCHIYNYTFINVTKSWKESQTYCRTYHTDLAILFNGTDEKRLSGSGGWIGLYHLQPASRQWHWSLPGETFSDTDTRWEWNEPNDGGEQQNCVAINRERKWNDLKCGNKKGFICCDGEQTCEVKKWKKNWRDAQIYCRDKNKDLMSGIKQFNLTQSDSQLSGEISKANIWLWIGLFRDRWKWSNGISSNFRNWESDQDKTKGEKCAWIDLSTQGKWKSADCTEEKTFFCFDGQCLVSTCHVYNYTFINVTKSWKESQTYCRTYHTDLAILFNGTDEKRLSGSGGWIGLYHLQPASRQWHWSLPGETFSDTDTRWEWNEPNDGGEQQNCVAINRERKWNDLKCGNKKGFICCDGEQTCEVKKWKKNWRDAQIYCRDKNKDLMSGIKQFNLTQSDSQLSGEISKANIWLWIGLFRDRWKWSNGISSNFRNWESDQDKTKGEKCAWIDLSTQGKWKSADCTEEKTFFCFDGQCLVSTCHVYNYTFINVTKSWKESQTYCRTYHTDLAILFNGTDEKRLSGSGGWIGLYHLQPASRQWHWSLPGETFSDTDTRWEWNEPNDGGEQQNCVAINRERKWNDLKCGNKKGFICCDGEQTCEVKKWKKKWRDAQIYCRDKNKDLMSGIKQFNLTQSDSQLSGEISKANIWLWIGLFRDRWKWSNGISSNFRNWESDQDKTKGEKCAWIDLSTQGKWKSADCTEEKTFFCFDDGMILIRENKTWEDAWDYCREKHRGLASVTDARQQHLIAAQAKMADTDHVWLGLRYSCTLDLWFWVTGEPFSSSMWPSNSEQEAKRCYAAVAMETGGNHKWSQIDDDEKFNFICIK